MNHQTRTSVPFNSTKFSTNAKGLSIKFQHQTYLFSSFTNLFTLPKGKITKNVITRKSQLSQLSSLMETSCLYLLLQRSKRRKQMSRRERGIQKV